MNIAKNIEKVIENQGRQKQWVAEMIKMPYSTFLYKMKKYIFSAKDLLKISKLLNINLEELKNEFSD